MWIPEKAIYGIVLSDGGWRGIDADTMRRASEVDVVTGEPIPQEEGVHYRTFPIS